MSKNKFYIDIDGVACNHAQAICNWVNTEYGLNSKPYDVTEWDYNFGPISFVNAVEICYANTDFIKSMPLYSGFLEFYNNLVNYMDAQFITTRTKCKGATREWLNKHFNNPSDVIFVTKKSEIHSMKYLIDDNIGECKTCSVNGALCFLIKRPWNINVATSFVNKNNIIIINSYNDVFKYVV